MHRLHRREPVIAEIHRIEPDPAAHDLRMLITKTSQMLNAAAVVHDIVLRWGAPSDTHQAVGVVYASHLGLP